MKCFLLLLVFCCSDLHAQLKVKETNPKTIIGAIKRSNNLIAELSYLVKGPGDTAYTLLFNNYEYKIKNNFKSVTFKGTSRTVDSLYHLLKAVFKPENEKNKQYSQSFKLGEDSVRIGITRAVGLTRQVFRGGGGFVYLTEKELNKLFGKKD